MDINAENGSSREKERDFTDLNNELAGRENTGRMKRFLSPEARTEIQEEKRREAAYQSMLDYLLLHDAEYASLYHTLENRVNAYELAAAKALQALNEQIAALNEQLEDMEEKADTLNGRKVFISRDGKRAYTEDGEEISAADMARITRSKDAPSWEDYQEAKKERDKSRKDHDDITRWQDDVLNPVKDRMKDKENPIPKDEIEGILEGMEKTVPKAMKPYVDDVPATRINTMPEERKDKQSYLNAPDVKACFDTAACMDIPDLSLDAVLTALPKPK